MHLLLFRPVYIMHLLFFCLVAQATWFASLIALRVEQLPLNYAATILIMAENSESDKLAYFCNTLWCLWKARNEHVIAGKVPNIQKILAQIKKMEIDIPQVPSNLGVQIHEPVRLPHRGKVILVDGSWDVQQKARTGMVVYNMRGDLVFVQFGTSQAFDPFHAEANAVLRAIQYIINSDHEGIFSIFTDCNNLVKVIHDKSVEDIPSWRAAEAVKNCINHSNDRQHQWSIQHTVRGAIETPHNLANWAQQSGKTEEGTPIQCQIAHLEIENRLNPEFFLA